MKYFNLIDKYKFLDSVIECLSKEGIGIETSEKYLYECVFNKEFPKDINTHDKNTFSAYEDWFLNKGSLKENSSFYLINKLRSSILYLENQGCLNYDKDTLLISLTTKGDIRSVNTFKSEYNSGFWSRKLNLWNILINLIIGVVTFTVTFFVCDCV